MKKRRRVLAHRLELARVRRLHPLPLVCEQPKKWGTLNYSQARAFFLAKSARARVKNGDVYARRPLCVCVKERSWCWRSASSEAFCASHTSFNSPEKIIHTSLLPWRLGEKTERQRGATARSDCLYESRSRSALALRSSSPSRSNLQNDRSSYKRYRFGSNRYFLRPARSEAAKRKERERSLSRESI